MEDRNDLEEDLADAASALLRITGRLRPDTSETVLLSDAAEVALAWLDELAGVTDA